MSILNKIIAFLSTVFILLIGFFFAGKRSAKNEIKCEQAEKILKNILDDKEDDENLDGISDDELHDGMRKFERPDK